MPEKKKDIYKLLSETAEFQKREKEEKEEKKEHWYVKLCKFTGSIMGEQAKNEMTEKYKKALSFLEWDLNAKQLNSAPLFVAYVGFFFAFIWAVLNYVFSTMFPPIQLAGFTLIGHPLGMGMGITWYFAPFVVAMGAMYYVQIFPMKAVETEKIKSLTYIPEIVNYLVMSMKVNPNLEKALKFAAEHGQGKVARDLKEAHFKIQVGEYPSVEQALDKLAWKWGDYSEEFKHALMLIRSSVMESDETKRNNLLDKAVEDVLDGIRDKMDMYSRALHQPSIYLYYFGVLLPLLLIIVIPVGAMMGGKSIGFLASLPAMIGIYNIGIPVAAFLLAKHILKSRPPTREIPQVPQDLPGLPKKGWTKIGDSQLPILPICAAIFIAIAVGSFFAGPIINPKPPSWEQTSHTPIIRYGGPVVGLVVAGSIYLWANNRDRRKRQMEIVKMEQEFQDSLYVLASRLGEGKPIEEALRHAADFLPESKATKYIFSPTYHNISSMGMTLRTALFDEAYGSLKNIPSDFIKGTMRIVADSMQLGIQTAAKSLTSLSMQIKDMQKVEKDMKKMLGDITNMMSAMSMFIAPVVLGITIALQGIIFSAMESMAESGIGGSGRLGQAGSGAAGAGMMSGFQMPSFGNKEVIEMAASSEQLLVVVALYMVEIVIVLMYFASHVNEGNNPLAFKMAVAKALPISVSIFFAVAFFAMQITTIG